MDNQNQSNLIPYSPRLQNRNNLSSNTLYQVLNEFFIKEFLSGSECYSHEYHLSRLHFYNYIMIGPFSKNAPTIQKQYLIFILTGSSSSKYVSMGIFLNVKYLEKCIDNLECTLSVAFQAYKHYNTIEMSGKIQQEKNGWWKKSSCHQLFWRPRVCIVSQLWYARTTIVPRSGEGMCVHSL